MSPVLGAIAFFVVTAMFITGLVLLVLGIHGRPQWHAPTCAACGYDLRGVRPAEDVGCPECGTSLGEPRAVRFGRSVRSPGRIVVGSVLMAPVLLWLVGGLLMAATRVRVQQLRSDQSVITSLSAAANQPMAWAELLRRYQAGQLDDGEISAAIEQLITHLAGRGPGSTGPLTWADQFVGAVVVDDRIPEDQLLRLCTAFYPETDVQLRSRVRRGSPQEFRLSGHAWHLPGFATIAALTVVRTEDGTALEVRDQRDRPIMLSMGPRRMLDGRFLTADMPPGVHDVTFVVDVGLVPSGTDLGPNDEPGPPDGWVDAVTTWRYELLRQIEVVPESEHAVLPLTDPGLEREVRGVVTVRSANLWDDRGRQLLKLSLDYERPAVPVCFDVLVQVGDERVRVGSFAAFEGTSSRRGGMSHHFDAVPESVATVDVILQPSFEEAERHMFLERIWAEPVVYESVPLTRR